MKKGNGLYKIIHSIGIIIRTVFIANAFEYYFNNLIVAYITNAAIGEFLLWKTTYHISVGNIYDKNSSPAWGSFLYIVFYIINNFLLILSCNICKFLSLDLVSVIILYGILLVIQVKLVDKARILLVR